MSREAQIPLALWVSAALVFHFVGGTGSIEVAHTMLDRQELRMLVQNERAELRPPDQTFEILDMASEPVPSPATAAPPDKESDVSDDAVEADPSNPDTAPRAKPPEPKAEAPKPDEAPKPAAPKPEPDKKPVPVVAVPVAPAPPPPPPKPDGRIAIKQHAEKNQPDNTSASRIAEDANTVKEETQARIRSHDQDDAKPNPGASKALGPKEEIGNSDKDKEAESEDRKGRDDRAPGEAAPASTSGSHSSPGNPGPKDLPVHGPPPMAAGKGGGARGVSVALPSGPPPSPGGAGPSSPEVQNGGGKTGWSLDPANPGGNGSSRVAGRRRPGQTTFDNPVHVSSIGLGGSGTPGGPNINLTRQGFEAAIGADKLREEREADGASRRGEHAGRMAKATDFQRYRAAIENYDPSVKVGDATALNAARVAWAGYLNSIHNKIHPFFADRELDAMDKYGNKDFRDQQMYAVAEIVIAPDTGRIVRRGIVKGSGSSAYDIIVLKSIDSSAPYGKAPDAVVSPDGKVYLHWEFHRNHFDACSTRNAYPLMRRASASATKEKPSPTGAPPKPANKTDESPNPNTSPLRPLHE